MRKFLRSYRILNRALSAAIITALALLPVLMSPGGGLAAEGFTPPLEPVVNAPAEPAWTVYEGAPITTTEELQSAIDAAGTTPLKIPLMQNIERTLITGVMASITVTDGQTIFLTSAGGEKYTVDAKAASLDSDTWASVIHVADGGTLFLDDIILTGGGRPIGGGGGVVLGLGLGASSPSENATLVMYGGAEIRGNQAGMGGGVYVSAGCRFYLLGGLITDNNCSYGQTLTNGGNAVIGKGGGVYVWPGGEFYMTDGEISYNNCDIGGNKDTDGVYVDGDETRHSTFTMTGGSVTRNGNPDNGTASSGITIKGGSTFNLSGGEISYHGKYSNYGGIAVRDSVFKMWGGKICNNKGFYGGAVTVVGSMKENTTGTPECSIFNMYGGVIGGDSYDEANTGPYPGIMIGDAGWGNQGGTFNMYGGRLSYNCGTDNRNGGLAVTNYGAANITGDAEISYNSAPSYGGGIYVAVSSLNISGNAQIINNVAAGLGGGGILAYSSEVTIRGNTKIAGNISDGIGGGLYARNTSAVSISDNVKIINNIAESDGGGIWLDSSSALVLNGGVIANNTAGQNGGGIFDNKNPSGKDYSNLSIPAGKSVTFYGNNAVRGGAVAVELPTLLGEWAGIVAGTSIDGAAFTGETKNAHDEFVEGGGDLRSLIVFNNNDINMTATEFFFTVTFETNGGTEIPRSIVPEYEKLTAPSSPTRAGYDFVEWCTDEELTTPYSFDDVPVSNMTLYAKWVLRSSIIIDPPAPSPTGTPPPEETPPDDAGVTETPTESPDDEPDDEPSQPPSEPPGAIIVPGVPGIPPPPATPGGSLVPGDEGGVWIEIGDDDTPLGVWHYDDEGEVWIFEPLVPESEWQGVPATSDGGAVWVIVLNVAAIGVLICTKKHSGCKNTPE
jgi:uncharacterized repeat protein (TIGR02543 family)